MSGEKREKENGDGKGKRQIKTTEARKDFTKQAKRKDDINFIVMSK